MKALILSGGTGSRLRPLTYTNAKQLIPIANKPTLFYIIEKVVNAGITDIGIIVGDTHLDIKHAVGNGERWNAKITYILQSLPLGLAHAVKTARWFIEDSDFLMILGDNLFQMNLTNFIVNFYEKKANASIILHRVNNPSQFGVAVIKNGVIEKLVEKPKEFISNRIITGIYIFDKTIFDAIDKIQASPRGELEITDSIQKLLESGGNITYTLTEGWWKDTGKLNDLLEANQLVLDDIQPSMKIVLQEGSSVRGKVCIEENVIIEKSIIHGPVNIANNAVIKNSYIGPYTSISKDVILCNSEIENSIILSGARLDNIDRRISNSLIGKDAIVGSRRSKPSSVSFLIGDNSEIWM